MLGEIFERILIPSINFSIFLQPQNVLNGKCEVAWFGLLHGILLIILVTSLGSSTRGVAERSVSHVSLIRHTQPKCYKGQAINSSMVLDNWNQPSVHLDFDDKVTNFNIFSFFFQKKRNIQTWIKAFRHIKNIIT